jgi:uncharacterized protein
MPQFDMDGTGRPKPSRVWAELPFIEPILIFSALFLPGYLGQGGDVDGSLFNSVRYDLIYIVHGTAQFALILYIMLNRPGRDPSIFRMRRPEPADLPAALTAFLLIWVAVIPVMLIGGLMEQSARPVTWSLDSVAILPLVLVVCLVTGYVEELFFRAYLLTVLETSGVPAVSAVAASSLLFAAGHLYQDIPGFIATGLIGVILSLHYLRKRSLHAVAWAHGLYNFANLALTLGAG